MRIEEKSIAELCELLEKGVCSSEDLAREGLAQIEKNNARVGAYLTACAEEALAQARAADLRRRNGAVLSRLDGIPYAAKDCFCTKGIRTTAASGMLRDYIPPYDATVISLLREAGAVLIGKTNMDEFSMGSATVYSALGQTRNPLDDKYVAGGSSGGSAAAVAMGSVPFALGSDTGGSVRQPAAYCGVMGLKPTYGAISRYGMIAFASSLDCVGLLARTAEDMAILMTALGRRDPLDATSLGYTGEALAPALARGVKNLRIGVSEDGGVANISQKTCWAVALAADCLRERGANVEAAALPSPLEALMAYCVISSVEASSNLARYDGFRYGSALDAPTPDARAAATRGTYLGAEVKSRILLGSAMLTGDFREKYYLPACKIRERIRGSVSELFEKNDVILQPTAPSGAHRADESLSALQTREMDLCTVYASLAGIPSMSVPFGKDESGMPLGVQIMAAPMREDLILRVASVLQAR